MMRYSVSLTQLQLLRDFDPMPPGDFDAGPHRGKSVLQTS